MEQMVLMHKNKEVALVGVEDGKILSYLEIYNKDEIPVGTYSDNMQLQKMFFNSWILGRTVPGERPNIENILNKLNKTRAELFVLNNGVSLTDTFWIKNKNDSLLWEDVNFHKNGFVPILARWYLNKDVKFAKTPDFTTDGVMEKFWINPDLPYLIKTDKMHDGLLCANEIVYFEIANLAGIKTTPYFDGEINNVKFCSCPSFITDDNSDFVTGLQIKHEDFTRNGEKLLNYLSKDLGLHKSVSEMITLDCILHNTDRHEKNFGYIKNGNNITLAPIFDNGCCLGSSYYFNKNEVFVANMYEQKLSSKSRVEMLKDYGLPINLDKKCCIDIIKDTYKLYNIDNFYLNRAIKELEYGLDIAEQAQLLNRHNDKVMKSECNEVKEELDVEI